ncbi:MAG TPA: hypothetical protein VL727_25365 [Puia sp.]|nr:hypothetical protein [Puia sp.]
MKTGSIQANKTTGRLVRGMLLAGIICFGIVFPDSLSDHEKLLHFSAHMGMSFLIAISVYVICNMTFHIGRKRSLLILSTLTLVIGAIYKYLEISGKVNVHLYSFGDLLKITGCYTSMSQNTAGLLAAILLIELISLPPAHSPHHAPAPLSLLSKAQAASHHARLQTTSPRA